MCSEQDWESRKNNCHKTFSRLYIPYKIKWKKQLICVWKINVQNQLSCTFLCNIKHFVIRVIFFFSVIFSDQLTLIITVCCVISNGTDYTPKTKDYTKFYQNSSNGSWVTCMIKEQKVILLPWKVKKMTFSNFKSQSISPPPPHKRSQTFLNPSIKQRKQQSSWIFPLVVKRRKTSQSIFAL